MQDTPGDISNNVGNPSISLNSSHNFQNMKRVIKRRIDTESSQSVPSSPVNMESSSSIQPPLPLEPPPQDHVPQIEIKTEIPSEVEDQNMENLEEQMEEAAPIAEIPESRKICREFVRGTCTRPVCRYAHEIDLLQLKGVYTFCRNYQNKVCTYPNCKYMHATVFEEQAFYRTGILPDKILSHHRRANNPQKAVMPPPSLKQPLHHLSHPPPPLPFHPGPAAMAPPMEPRPHEFLEVKQMPTMSEAAARGPGPSTEQNKCSQCDFLQFRVDFNKEKLHEKIKTSQILNKKIADVTKRNLKLNRVLHTLCILFQKNNTGSTIASGSMDGVERDSTVLEQLTAYLAMNRPNNEDN